MLFVISSNEKKQNDDVNIDNDIVKEETLDQDSFAELVEKFDKESEDIEEEIVEKTEKNEETSMPEDSDSVQPTFEENHSEEKEMVENSEAEEKKTGLLKRIFSKKEEKEEIAEEEMWENESKDDKKVSEKSTEVQKDSDKKVNEKVSEKSTEKSTEIPTEISLVKDNSSMSIAHGITDMTYLVPPSKYKNRNADMETAIWNIYEIEAYSLKLNNKYFNKTIAYLQMHDRLIQTGAENSHGCFEVEVQDAKYVTTWTKGYVCKKYLNKISHTTQIEGEDIISDGTVSSEIGDLVQVAQDIILEDGSMLSQGDFIDQWTTIDENGCFHGIVFTAKNISNLWKTLNYCK